MIKNSKNKRVWILVMAIILIVIVTGVSYAWYNYRAETSNKQIIAGDIYLTLNENSGQINLSNVFPETKEEARARDDNFVTFSLSGLNTSDKTVYYEILLNYGTSKESPYQRYNDKDLVFDLVELDSNGNEVKYVVDARSYDSVDNIRIWADEIGTTSTEVVKRYKLRMWLSDKVIISDTAANASYPATGANSYKNHYASVKVAVFGDFTYKEPPLTAFDKITKNVNTTTQINFADPSSDSNGKGLYILKGTENDTNPIYYYRGAIDNNNVVFGGFCWQIIRTTDTGGIKMIYNGLPDITGSGANISYNCGTTRDIQDTIMTTTSLNQSTGYYYADDYEIVSTEGNSVTYRLKSKTNPITQVAIANATAASSNIPTIATNYPYTCKQTTNTATCTTLYKVDSYASGTNANVYSSIDRPIIGRSTFNSDNQSVSDVGYMSNTIFAYSTSGWTTNALFASSAMWTGTNYTLTDASVTTPDTTHHYSCNATTSDATCTSLRYVYYVSGTQKHYITLTNGDLIEDALYKMTGSGSTTTKAKNASYVLNKNDSTAKTAIDNWFKTNLTSEVNASNPDYSAYLEDTVFCNDRSYKTEGSSSTYTQSGWNPSGGDLSTYLYFGTSYRRHNSYYSTTNVPSMTCSEIDRFTRDEANGNGALKYPVGLITADEIILAGVGGNSSSTTTYYYLYTNDYYWSLSPGSFNDRGSGFRAGKNWSSYYVDYMYGLRPVVSLKPGTKFDGDGNGEGTNPYIVKMGE